MGTNVAEEKKGNYFLEAATCKKIKIKKNDKEK